MAKKKKEKKKKNLFEKVDRRFRNTDLKVSFVSEFRVVKPKISSRYVLHRTENGKREWELRKINHRKHGYVCYQKIITRMG